MAFFQESRPAREPFLNAPSTVLWLIGIILVAHAARVFAPDDLSEPLLVYGAFLPGRFSGAVMAAHSMAPASLFHQALTFVSYIFLHANFGHATINSLWLLVFGPAVARRFRPLKFYLFFFFCGIVAAAVHLAANWGSMMPVVGASGAIAGLMGAAIRILYGRRYARHDWGTGLAPIFAGPVLFFTAVWCVINVLAGMTGLGVPGGGSVLVAWEAHLGGYFAGLLFVDMFDALRIGPRNRMAR